MDEADYYRGEARRCLELGASAPDRRIARRWFALAHEYATLAEEKAAAGAGRASILSAPMHRQPIQQQQQKIDRGQRKR